MSIPHQITRIQAMACRAPLQAPVETSFGRMVDRPAVFVRLEASDGCFGWGEIFANWPVAGAEHRVNLLEQDISPLVLGQSIGDPAQFFEHLCKVTHIRALQCGEWGPFRQVLAGIDSSLWDLKARAAGIPLRQLINPSANDLIDAYASGIHINHAEAEIEKARKAGFRAFKVKVGFDVSRDISQIKTLASGMRPDERLFADANQGFSPVEAELFLTSVEGCGLGWLEEPIPADAPETTLEKLAKCASIPLAGGENLAGFKEFHAAIEAGSLRYIQPDVAKWGGVTGCYRVAKAAQQAGLTYCPHFLGGGIGLTASAEILAAAGGDGLLEVDVNANPLREAFALPSLDADGLWNAGSVVSMGCDRLPDAVSKLISRRIDLCHSRVVGPGTT